MVSPRIVRLRRVVLQRRIAASDASVIMRLNKNCEANLVI